MRAWREGRDRALTAFSGCSSLIRCYTIALSLNMCLSGNAFEKCNSRNSHCFCRSDIHVYMNSKYELHVHDRVWFKCCQLSQNCYYMWVNFILIFILYLEYLANQNTMSRHPRKTLFCMFADNFPVLKQGLCNFALYWILTSFATGYKEWGKKIPFHSSWVVLQPLVPKQLT